MNTTIPTASAILTAARNCDWSLAADAFRAINNDGDGFDPEDDDLGTLIGSEDGLNVYDDHGDAVIVADANGSWAVRVCAMGE